MALSRRETKSRAAAGPQQRLQLVAGQDRDRDFRDRGRLHVDHRVAVDLALFHQEGEEQLEALVPGLDRGWRVGLGEIERGMSRRVPG